MFTVMNDRLQQFLDLEQLSPARLADLLGIQRSGISHILSGRNKPGFDFIHKFLLKFPHVNAEWLITGKGKPYKNSDAAETMAPSQPDLFAETVSGTLPHPAVKTSIRRITVFYSDDSFQEFYPQQ